MRTINWQQILSENRIPSIDRGPNVKRGELNIKCPFCGSADPSYHMGLNLESGNWACWRNENHRGKSPLRLLVQLLNVSYGEARRIAGLDDGYVDPDGFNALAARLLVGSSAVTVKPEERRFLQFPRVFVPLRPTGASTAYWDYLLDRRFSDDAIDELAHDYGVRAALSGLFACRVVFPYFLDRKLVSWTARAIGPAILRYRALSDEDSLVAPRDLLYNHDAALSGGELLVVVEGPVDALKLDVGGKRYGVRSVALATNSVSEMQLYTLAELSRDFDYTCFMMDNKAREDVVDSLRMTSKMAGAVRNGFAMPVPFGAKDAGVLTLPQVRQFATRWRSMK